MIFAGKPKGMIGSASLQTRRTFIPIGFCLPALVERAVAQTRLAAILKRVESLPKVSGEDIRVKSPAYREVDSILHDTAETATGVGVPLASPLRDEFIRLGDAARRRHQGYGNIAIADAAHRIVIGSELYGMSRLLRTGAPFSPLTGRLAALDRTLLFSLVADEEGGEFAQKLDHDLGSNDGGLVLRVVDVIDPRGDQRVRAGNKPRLRPMLSERLWAPLIVRFMETGVLSQALMPALAEYLSNGGSLGELSTDAIYKKLDVLSERFYYLLGGGRFVYSPDLEDLALHPEKIDAKGPWYE